MELEIFFEAMFQLAMTYVARREAADYAKFIANVRGRISDWAVVRTPHPLPDHAGLEGWAGQGRSTGGWEWLR